MTKGLPWKVGRKFVSILLGIAAALGFLSGAMIMLGVVPGQLAREQEYARNFRQTEAYVVAYQAGQGHLPSEAELQVWAEGKGLGLFATNLTLRGCMNEFFKKEKGDRFVISFWRGEWDDCYASPSGRTTLSTSTDWGRYFAIHFLMSAVLGFFAWLIFPRSKRSNLVG
ncbi:MAG TPA: hypothetical protein VJL82_07115 [Rhizomicrobium sp.]|nr:hypothetical protein [Rhizomicrobium sp.]